MMDAEEYRTANEDAKPKEYVPAPGQTAATQYETSPDVRETESKSKINLNYPPEWHLTRKRHA